MLLRTVRRHRRPLVDVAMAGAVAVLFVLSGTAVSLPLAVLQLVPLVVRRRLPGTVLVVIAVATALHTTAGMARAIGFLPVTIALYTAAQRSRLPHRWLLCPAAGLLVAWASATRHGLVEGALTAIVIVIVAWLAGVERDEHLRQRTEATRLRLERRIAEQDAAAAADRERLARRVHDTLANTVTVMVLHAEALRPELAPDRRRHADVIMDAGRAALAEVRAALADADDAVPLDDRLDLLRASGLRLSGPVPTAVHDLLAPPVQRVAERLIGEAATNALRHDGPGTRFTVTVGAGPGTLMLRTTSDAAQPHPPGRDTSGFGLASLARQVTECGGDLRYGPVGTTGWEVVATLPSIG